MIILIFRTSWHTDRIKRERKWYTNTVLGSADVLGRTQLGCTWTWNRCLREKQPFFSGVLSHCNGRYIMLKLRGTWMPFSLSRCILGGTTSTCMGLCPKINAYCLSYSLHEGDFQRLLVYHCFAVLTHTLLFVFRYQRKAK
jgi:hypothetical protein